MPWRRPDLRGRRSARVHPARRDLRRRLGGGAASTWAALGGATVLADLWAVRGDRRRGDRSVVWPFRAIGGSPPLRRGQDTASPPPTSPGTATHSSLRENGAPARPQRPVRDVQPDHLRGHRSGPPTTRATPHDQPARSGRRDYADDLKALRRISFDLGTIKRRRRGAPRSSAIPVRVPADSADRDERCRKSATSRCRAWRRGCVGRG